jgi:hypothetical protein
MLTKIANALFNDLIVVKRVMAQSIRDNWPGINQPYRPKDNNGNQG